jgi:hypothetical protein
MNGRKRNNATRIGWGPQKARVSPHRTPEGVGRPTDPNLSEGIRPPLFLFYIVLDLPDAQASRRLDRRFCNRLHFL